MEADLIKRPRKKYWNPLQPSNTISKLTPKELIMLANFASGHILLSQWSDTRIHLELTPEQRIDLALLSSSIYEYSNPPEKRFSMRGEILSWWMGDPAPKTFNDVCDSLGLNVEIWREALIKMARNIESGIPVNLPPRCGLDTTGHEHRKGGQNANISRN